MMNELRNKNLQILFYFIFHSINKSYFNTQKSV